MCKAGWRCRSLHQSSASVSSRTSLVFLWVAQRGAAEGSTNRFIAVFRYVTDTIWMFLLVSLVVLTCLWHLDFPDDNLWAEGRCAVALGVTSTHRATAVHRVHAVHVRAWTHTTTHTVLNTHICSLHQAWWEQRLMCCTELNSKEIEYNYFPKF